MQLKPGSILQNGKYAIVRTLGQGGFGITYEAEQVLLRQNVAIKEFFMKDCCERDESTNVVTVGTGNQRKLVEKFRGKFIREAQMIAGLDHPNIVRVTDVFEENGTAYYVMEKLPGGSLAEKVKKEGAFSETLAEKYIRQVADALAYIHSRNTVHLDVKPSNILLNTRDEAVLIDFGISKHYDDSGEQTSSTPVGISKGYAPLEQSRDGDVSQFGPATDIYALGASLYYLVTGDAPPEASIVNEDGLERHRGISDRIWKAIEQCMRPRRKDRPQTIEAFLSLLEATVNSEETVILSEPEQKPEQKFELKKPITKVEPKLTSPTFPSEKKKSKAWLWALITCAIVAAIITGIVLGGRKGGPGVDEPTRPVDSTVVAPAVEQTLSPNPEPVVPGSVMVSSTPAGATIWLDGKNTTKTTPMTIEDLTPGKHSVKLVLEGYNDYSGSIAIASGKQSELSQTLKKKEKPAAVETPAPVETSAPVDKPTPAGKPTTGTINGHDWVNLGLPSGLKWATCNVGASSPSDYGSYYAWGETKSKSEYTWENYKFRVTGDLSDNVTFNKYNTDSKRGTVDNKKKLELSDDAARQNWGGTWRMPTYGEWRELKDKCTWTLTTQGGKNGYRVTSKTNGNSIFLPAAGLRYRGSLYNAGSLGSYWSSSLYTDYPGYAWSSDEVYRDSDLRFYGLSVRPVTE